MSRIRKSIGWVLGLFGRFLHAIRERWPVLTVIILGTCVPIYAMAWWLNAWWLDAWWLDVYNNLPINILPVNIAITFLATTIPIIHLFSPSERLTCKSQAIWLSIFSWLALVVFVGEEYYWRFLSFSGALVLLALPYGLFFWQIARHEWLLYVGLMLALAATMVYWIAALSINEEGFDLVLLPLPIILAGGVVWAFIASRTLKSARRRKNRRISGPGMQALAMTMLFFPVTLVAISLPLDLGLHEAWLYVSLALIGLLLSGVISEPLRLFLIEWGKLAPSQNAPTSPNPYAE